MLRRENRFLHCLNPTSRELAARVGATVAVVTEDRATSLAEDEVGAAATAGRVALPALRHVVVFTADLQYACDTRPFRPNKRGHRGHAPPRHCRFEEFQDWDSGGQSLRPSDGDRRALASVMHTSGTTGLPKGIPFSREVWAGRIGIKNREMSLNGRQRVRVKEGECILG